MGGLFYYTAAEFYGTQTLYGIAADAYLSIKSALHGNAVSCQGEWRYIGSWLRKWCPSLPPSTPPETPHATTTANFFIQLIHL